MRELLLGVDIGTSACKVAVFNKQGEVIASGNGGYQVYYPHPGWAEQNPDEWWSAVCSAIGDVLKKGNVKPEEIKGIGVDGQSWSAIPIDKDGNVLTNTPIWMDTRAQSICDRLNVEIGADNIFQVAGNSMQPSYSTAKILWYKENMPEVYANTYKILQSKALNVYSFLSDIYECSEIVGGVSEKAAKEPGLLEGTPVVAGALDAACGTLGSGVIHPGETQEQGGQAGGMSICLDEYAADPRLILSYHAVPNQWILQGGTVGGGGVMRWIEKELGDYERSIAKECGKSSLVQFNELAEKVPAGSDGLIFLPYMSGERSPIWDPNAKGVYYGLDFSKTKGHLIRAAMEGVAYSLKHNLDIGEKTGAKVEELLAMGGSANSLLWTQIKCDVTGKPITVPSSDTATTLGAVMLAGVGIGMYKDFEEAVKITVKKTRHHEPDMEKHAIYQKNYETYLEIYENLKETMKKTGGM